MDDHNRIFIATFDNGHAILSRGMLVKETELSYMIQEEAERLISTHWYIPSRIAKDSRRYHCFRSGPEAVAYLLECAAVYRAHCASALAAATNQVDFLQAVIAGDEGENDGGI